MEKNQKKYTCPMHPEINQDLPGMCPECGMNLVSVATKKDAKDCCHGEKKHDHGKSHKHHSLLGKFWVSLVLTIPIFFYSEMASMVFRINPPRFSGDSYVFLLIGSLVFFYCGSIFLSSAYREIKAKLPGMMTLIAIAVTSAYTYSLVSIVFGSKKDLLFELSSLITIMLLGHWIEMKSVQRAKGALKELSKLLPDQVEVLRDGKKEIISINDLKEGDIVLVRPGSKIPADGQVIDGQSQANESIVTGESKPIEKGVGDQVIAGSINGDGALKIKVEKIGNKTFLAGVMKLIAEAQASKSRLQILSDRAAFYLTFIAVLVSIITFFAWLISGGGVVTATERLVAVLVIACPHALGLAVPLVASISTTLGAKIGLLVKDRRSLENARNINVVLFDKTGTLTKGEFGVSDVLNMDDVIREEILRVGASANIHSEHPLGKAIVKECEKKNINLSEVKNFSRVAGEGVTGLLDGVKVFVGSEKLIERSGVRISEEYLKRVNTVSEKGKSVIHIALGGKLLGGIALSDEIREESKEAIRSIKNLGIKTAMITGDSDEVAKLVANELGIDEFFSRVLPGDKVNKVKILQDSGNKVAMVGDGVNDAPALTQADLGIAVGAGTNVAIESAGIILVKNDPRDIPRIFKLSRLTYRKMIQNLFWATGYNVVAIPLAAGALASKGIILEPAVAAILMSLSTVIVAINATFLKKTKL